MPYCHLCSKDFHYLGIARHRAKHRDAKEDCLITYSDGKTYRYNYSEKVEARTKGIKDEG